MGMERYKGFLIDGSAIPTFEPGFDWYLQGIILRPARLGSIVELKLNPKAFVSKIAIVYRPSADLTRMLVCDLKPDR